MRCRCTEIRGDHVQEVRHLTAVIERDRDGYVALCPEVDVASQGETIEEARRNLQEAVELFFETASAAEIDERYHSEVYVTHLDIAVG
jgi:predicted RNase H-like HicB family nuclease